MISAHYGRMRIGRCLKHAQPSSIGCSSDVLTEMDRYCSGRFYICSSEIYYLLNVFIALKFDGNLS